MGQSTTFIVRKVWSKDIDPPIRKYINAENFEQYKEKGKSQDDSKHHVVPYDFCPIHHQ